MAIAAIAPAKPASGGRQPSNHDTMRRLNGDADDDEGGGRDEEGRADGLLEARRR